MNPLLDFSGLPRFGEIKVEHITPAIDRLLAENQLVIASLSAQTTAPEWDGFVIPLEDANERLGRAWGTVAHLNAVMNSPEWRAAYNENLPKVTEYYASLAQHPDLYRAFSAIRQSPGFAGMSRERQQAVENELRDFRLGGADLPEEDQVRFRNIQAELAQLGARFEENLLDATNGWAMWLAQDSDLAGLPDDVILAAREAADREERSEWKFTLHAPSYIPFMQYAESRDLRERMYHAYATRASEFGPSEQDNTALIERILELRQQAARLLGFADYAQLSLATKMADTPEQVVGFLRDLAARARPYAERDLAELREFAATQLGVAELQSWDLAWASEKLRVARYDFSDQAVRQYFPEPVVLSGLFRLVNTLYGLDVRPGQAPVWHPDVRFFDVFDEHGALIGQFYLDLYAREHKRGGAWMDDAITRCRKGNTIQLPVTWLTCNFSAPVGGRPALFTHDEVLTLFHEFGHGLHHLLTKVEERAVSGIHGVEWDAVELPSQFMENFCWEWDVLQHMTAHVDTGEPLPRDLFDRMVGARNFQSGLATLRQIEFALFDMQLHDHRRPIGESALDLLLRVRKEVAVMFPPVYNRFANSFSHIFAGGYAAGYYSYKWAEVLSADVYSLFEEQGILSASVGRRFRDEVLAVGGARPARESFLAFRGRDPEVAALLRHSGMV